MPSLSCNDLGCIFLQVDKSNSAVHELRGILDSMGSTPIRKRLGAMGAASTESELERILRRRKVTTDQDASAGTLSTLESRSMPVLGSAISPARDQKLRVAEFRTEKAAGGGGGEGQPLLPDKRLHTKVSSHSAETLGYAGDEKKSEEKQSSLKLQPPGESDSSTTRNVDTPNKRGKDTDSSHC